MPNIRDSDRRSTDTFMPSNEQTNEVPGLQHRTALASFPRSGNTWLRFLIENATGARSGSVYTDRILPRNGEGVVIKTHELDSAQYTRAVHVVRHPLDAIESYYHWRKDVAKQANVDWQAHVREAGERWRLHTEHWLACRCPAYRLRYEDLHAAPKDVLRKLLEWLGLEVSDAQIDAAVANSSIDKMRELDSKLGPVFFRRGSVGASQSAFSPSEQEYIAGRLRPYLEKFGYQ
jgi:hypothetical protein